MNENLKDWSLRMAKLENGQETRAGSFGCADAPASTLEVVRTSKWTAQHTRNRAWYVTRRVWFTDGKDTWEPHRGPSGRVRYFRSYVAALTHAQALNDGH